MNFLLVTLFSLHGKKYADSCFVSIITNIYDKVCISCATLFNVICCYACYKGHLIFCDISSHLSIFCFGYMYNHKNIVHKLLLSVGFIHKCIF